MTLYRAFIGTTETVFFVVPAPGYYDPMIDPEFVWQDWEKMKVGNISELEAEDSEAEVVPAAVEEIKPPAEQPVTAPESASDKEATTDATPTKANAEKKPAAGDTPVWEDTEM
jgi:hypothetical protein